MEFDIKSASDYPLTDLVKLLNRGFENYFAPIQFNVPALLAMLRKGRRLEQRENLIHNGINSRLDVKRCPEPCQRAQFVILSFYAMLKSRI